MKYPRPVYGIEPTSGGPAGAPITPADPTAAAGSGQPAAALVPPVDPAAGPAVPAVPVDWRAALPEELRASPTLNDINDVNSLAKQFVDQQAFMGNALRVPGPDAGPEDVNSFHARLVEKVPGLMPRPDPTDPDAMTAVYDAMGRPAAAADYQNPVVEGSPQLSDELGQAYAESAYKNGLSQVQYHNVMADFVVAQGREMAGVQAGRDLGLSELKQEWGYTYEGRMQAVEGVMTQMGFSPTVIEALQGNGIPKQDVTAFYKIVQALGGEESIAHQQGGVDNALTPAEAELQIQEIMNKPEYLHHDFNVRKPWMDKVGELMKFTKRRERPAA